MQNEYPAEADANEYPTGHSKACIQNDKECEIQIIISCCTDQAQQADTALEADEESEVDDAELIKASEEVLSDVGNRSVVTVEDAAGREADQDAENG